MNISIIREGVEIGEWTEEEVRDFYREGRLLDTDFYWKEGMTEWTPLSGLIRPPPPFPSRKATARIPALSSDTARIPSISDSSSIHFESTPIPTPRVVKEVPLAGPTPQIVPPVPIAIPDQAKYPSLGRLSFLGIVLAITFGGAFLSALIHASPSANPIAILVGLILLAPIAARLINMGYSGWYTLLSFVPLVGFILFCVCLLIPPDYKTTKQLDAGTRIGFFVGVGLFVLVTAISVLILLGTPVTDSPEAANYRAKATAGNVWASRKLGMLYLDGKGVPKNYTEALKWLQVAADKGDDDSQYAIGSMYENGQGVTQDYGQAFLWYQKSADQGDEFGQFTVANMYFRGQGVTQDFSQALIWFQKSADQGYFYAESYIGYMYQNGKGVAQDYGQALARYQKAADHGDAMAQDGIGSMYENGQGVPQDTATAVEWYRKAAAQGQPDAQAALKRLGQ